MYSRLSLNLKYDDKRRKIFAGRERSDNFHKWSFLVLNNTINRKVFPFFPNEKQLFGINYSLYIRNAYKSRNQSISRIRNRCRLSRNSSSISRFFRLSRSTFKEDIKHSHRFVGVSSFPYSKSKSRKITQIKKK
jgi:ribosomal protein S14